MIFLERTHTIKAMKDECKSKGLAERESRTAGREGGGLAEGRKKKPDLGSN